MTTISEALRFRLVAMAVLCCLIGAHHVVAADTRKEKPAPCVAILTKSSGLSALDVEQSVTAPIERALARTDGVARIESRSVSGVSMVKAHFRPGDGRLAALALVHALMGRELENMPPGTEPPLVVPFEPAHGQPVGIVAVDGATRAAAELSGMARATVLPGLRKLPGVTAPGAWGMRQPALVVSISRMKLQGYGLSAADVLRAVGRARLPKRIGTFSLGGLAYEFAGNGTGFERLKEVALTAGATAVYLRDVGVVEDSEVPAASVARLNGRRQLCLPLYRKSGAAPDVGAIEKRLAELSKELPKGVRLKFYPLGAGGEAKGKAGSGLLTIHLRAAAGTTLDASEKGLAEVERGIEETIPASQRSVICSELGRPSDLTALYSPNTGPQDMTVRVRLRDGRSAGAEIYVDKLRRLCAKKFPGLRARFHVGAEPDAQVTIQVRARNLEQGSGLSQKVRERVAKIKGAVDVYVAQQMGPSLLVEVDRAKAARAGRTEREINEQLALAGDQGLAFGPPLWGGTGAKIKFVVRYADRPTTLEGLLDLPVASPKGEKPVLLRDLAAIRRTTAPEEIDHVNLRRVFTVRANVTGRQLRDVVADIDKALKGLEVPKGVRVERLGAGPARP